MMRAKREFKREFIFRKEFPRDSLERTLREQPQFPELPAHTVGNFTTHFLDDALESNNDTLMSPASIYSAAGRGVQWLHEDACAIAHNDHGADEFKEEERRIKGILQKNKRYLAEIKKVPGDPKSAEDKLIHLLKNELYIRLTWNEVRVCARKAGKDKGYFPCFGWQPMQKYLLFRPQDFIPIRTPQEQERALKPVPEGRGLPLDVVQTDANCGPSAAAAYLDITCGDFIGKSRQYREKQFIPITPMREVLAKLKRPHESIKMQEEIRLPSEAFAKHPAGMAFVQVLGPWYGHDHWSQEYAHTHWIAYDRGMVYDVNAKQFDGAAGNWISEKEWMKKIAPTLWAPKSTGHFIKNILIPANHENAQPLKYHGISFS